VVDRDHTSDEVQTVLRAVDGNDVHSGWSISDAEEIQVRNPFRPRTLAVMASVSWTEVRDIFVDVRYEDSANDVVVEDTLYLNQTTNPPPFVVDLRDPTQTAIEYTVTFSYVDGHVVQLPPSVTYGSRLVVDPKNHELRFEDFLENLSYAEELELDGPDSRARFEFDYADVARNKYEWRSTVLFHNGLRHSTNWTASAEPTLVPLLP
jgi:hypothetical protein